MTKPIKKLKKELPQLTGIYLFKNNLGTIIYIGKAKNIKSRVNSYFQKYTKDWKIKYLIDEYNDIDYIVTPTETESLLLEAQLVQKYKPKFNTLLKEGQPFLYILFTKSDVPTVKLVRNKKEKGSYFGPFLQKTPARKTYNFLMQTFNLILCNKKIEHGCLNYHIESCAGNCKSTFNLEDYYFRLQLAADALKNNQVDFIEKIKLQIKKYNAELSFEKAKRIYEYLQNVDLIFSTLNTHFNENKFETDIFVASTPTPYIPSNELEINKQLQIFLSLPSSVRTIDCFDISHFQSNNIVGSCVRFTDGQPDKSKFRRFTIRTLNRQNDYAALQEIVLRRYKEKNDYPDVILIDGGKGQLNAIMHIINHPCIISLAKQEEILYGSQFPKGIHLNIHSPTGKLLIALRDYAHHFAISYHRFKRKKELL